MVGIASTASRCLNLRVGGCAANQMAPCCSPAVLAERSPPHLVDCPVHHSPPAQSTTLDCTVMCLALQPAVASGVGLQLCLTRIDDTKLALYITNGCAATPVGSCQTGDLWSGC
jgi:hypothetical protein